MVSAAFVFVLLFPAADGKSPDAAVQGALKAGRVPWYDAAKDDFRPVTPPKPPDPPTTSSWSLPSLNLGAISTVLMWLLLVVVVAALIAFAVHNIRLGSLDATSEIVDRDAAVDRLEALPTGVRRVSDYFAEAERCVARQAFDEAMIYYYAFQLLALDKAGQIELQKGKTNGRYVRELRQSAPQLMELFAPATRLFEDVFFGKLPLADNEFLQLWKRRATFVDLMREGSAKR